MKVCGHDPRGVNDKSCGQRDLVSPRLDCRFEGCHHDHAPPHLLEELLTRQRRGRRRDRLQPAGRHVRIVEQTRHGDGPS